MAKVGEAKSDEQRRAVVAAIVDEGRGAREVVAAAAAGDLNGVPAFTIGRSTAAEWAKAEREARQPPHEQVAAVRDDAIRTVRALLRDVRKAGEATPSQLKALNQLPNLLRGLERDAKAATAAAPVVDGQSAEPGEVGFLERLAQQAEQPTAPASASPEPAETPTTPIQPSTDPTVHPWCRECQAGRCDTHAAPATNEVIPAHTAPHETARTLTEEQRAQVEQILRPVSLDAEPETDPRVREWKRGLSERQAQARAAQPAPPPEAPEAPAPRPAPAHSRSYSSLTRQLPSLPTSSEQPSRSHYYG